MSDTAVITGDFCTFRHVQGRKVLQIVIEVPAEAAGSVFAKLGMPGSGEGVPVAVVRLTAAPETIAKPEAAKERRAFKDLPYATQAAMRCQEPDFARFLQERQGPGGVCILDDAPDRSDWVASHVRFLCDVKSRADIGKTLVSMNLWSDLEAEYWAWQRGAR